METFVTIRHDDIFDRTTFLLPIHVIGVGGIGSRVVEQLSKLGCGDYNRLEVWDDDTVAPHNLANQVYEQSDIGQPKTVALAGHMECWTGNRPFQHPHYGPGGAALKGVVFACVDNMDVRRMIWESGVKNNPEVSLFIETRMDALNGLIHVVDPNNLEHIRQWERYWHPETENTNQIAGCGTHIAVGPTACLVADLAVWEFIRFAAIARGEDEEINNQIRLALRPLTVETFQW